MDMDMESNPTPKMKDVAELAGVSIKTVSRVLNNEPHVQDQLRDRVRAAVKKLNYVPSRSARSLRGSKSYTINLICHSVRSAYVAAIQFGAVVACQELGYQLSISLMEDLIGKPVRDIRVYFERLKSAHNPDGVMLVAPFASDESIAYALQETEIPVVRIGPINMPNRGTLVQIDDYKAATQLTEHLLSLGHHRIGFVRGIEDQRATHIRYEGYCAALKAAGIQVEPRLVHPGKFDFQSGLDAGESLLSLQAPPTAIFASNDDMAAGVVTAASKAGLKVPNDLSVVGFDDSEIAVRMWPNLTTIHQPLQELGHIAIENLIKQLGVQNLADDRTIVLDHEFILRESTAPIS